MGSSKPVSPEARVISVAGRLTDCWRGGTETSSALAELLEAVRTFENKQHARETSDDLRGAAEFASGVLAELYAKYQTKIGPFASQAQVANGRLRAALKASEEQS